MIIISCPHYLDDQENILYEFKIPTPNQTEIISALAEDINEDGLKDIQITLGFIGAPDMETIEWVGYQMEDGLFYSRYLKDLFDTKTAM